MVRPALVVGRRESMVVDRQASRRRGRCSEEQPCRIRVVILSVAGVDRVIFPRRRSDGCDDDVDTPSSSTLLALLARTLSTELNFIIS